MPLARWRASEWRYWGWSMANSALLCILLRWTKALSCHRGSWWALLLPAATPDRESVQPSIPRGVAPTRSTLAVCAIILSCLDIHLADNFFTSTRELGCWCREICPPGLACSIYDGLDKLPHLHRPPAAHKNNKPFLCADAHQVLGGCLCRGLGICVAAGCVCWR
jgi:hypothetical protein